MCFRNNHRMGQRHLVHCIYRRYHLLIHLRKYWHNHYGYRYSHRIFFFKGHSRQLSFKASLVHHRDHINHRMNYHHRHLHNLIRYGYNRSLRHGYLVHHRYHRYLVYLVHRIQVDLDNLMYHVDSYIRFVQYLVLHRYHIHLF